MVAKPPSGLPVSPPSPPSAASPTPAAPLSPPAQRTPPLPPDTAPGRRPRRRWEVWRSPEGQPRWARPALLGVAALAALLYAWNITAGGLAPYYSVAARSMTESWKAFLFTAYDPSATITLDKIGGFLWPQALSARLFGFHDWALTLPQCIEGVVAVLVLYRVVRRWQGPAAGLLAAGLLTLTPVTASLFGHPIPDAALIMCLVLAVDRFQLAVRGARLRSLVWAGVWVGLAFQAKMMQAWLIVPALAIGYLVTAPVTRRARIGHLLTAGAVLFAVSFSWVLMMTFTPKDVRPYADGSTNNSALSTVFEYNGFSRPADNGPGGQGGQPGGTGGHPGGPATTGGPTGHTATPPVAGTRPRPRPATATGGKPSHSHRKMVSLGSEKNTWYKLLTPRFTPQIGWLYPLALIGLVHGLVLRGRRPRTDRLRGGYLMWGGWLLTTAVVLSVVDIPHTAYVAGLAPALAALAAAGAVTLWRTHRTATSAPARLLLPLTITVQAAWASSLAADHTGFAPWLIPTIITAALVSITTLLSYGRTTGRRLRPVALTALTATCVALFAAPAAWSLSVLDQRYAGSSFEAHAGPGGQNASAGAPGSAVYGGAGGASYDMSPAPLTAAQKRLLGYVQRHHGNATYTLSADGGWARSRAITHTGLPILPLGGFAGMATSVTLAEYRHLVASGQLRFALLNPTVPAAGRPSETSKINTWVRATCTKVNPKAYASDPTTPEPLYDCAPPS
ncbi:ArnT family glycosyltransferase [Streptomyces paromomycinus]|uniref:Glycosyl transferase n=1 Tax=Streptomyces paromomycinus TaxID=92743 RepID=A0A401WAC5_STREY|nr:glycosyltransferase family 39 protein [Streptomyces paromomycinus]GCD46267.1 glycosyl transferase [Streptomyces paromomycinus]